MTADERTALELKVAKIFAENTGKEWWNINQASKCVWRNAAAAAIDIIRNEVLEEAANEIDRLREALQWYADETNYEPRTAAFGDGVYAPHVINDKGCLARVALIEKK